MDNAFEFFKTNRVFFIASCEDGGKARVRPFGFTMKWNDRLYFCTGNMKDVYRQMVKYPDVEISAMGADGTWIRVRGRVVMDASREAKAQAFKEAPDLLKIYPGGADNETFVTFYVTSAEATLYSFSAPPKKLPLI